MASVTQFIEPKFALSGGGLASALDRLSTDPSQPHYRYLECDDGATIVYTGPGGEVVVPSNIADLPVVSIHADGFRNCATLTSVTIPDSVTSVGPCAFADCINLTHVVLPQTIANIESATFLRCRSLTSMPIPATVKRIGQEAFGGCTRLSTFSIPAGVGKIGRGAFRGCRGLLTIEVATGNESFSSVDGVLFSKDHTRLIAYPGGKDGVCEVSKYVTSIDIDAFADCENLEAIDVHGANEYYSNNENGLLFNKFLTALIRCPGSVSGSVTMPASLTTIDEYAFYGCIHLDQINIPDEVFRIGSWAFANCINLSNIALPRKLTKICDGIFAGCAKLGSISIPNSVRTINEAFDCCSSLASITIPASVKWLNGFAFFRCTSLKEVIFLGDAPQVDPRFLFSYAPNVTVYYLPNTSGWSHFFGNRPAVLRSADIK